MGWESFLPIAGQVLGGLGGSDAAGQAAQQQVDASGRAIGTTQAAADRARGDIMPFLQNGTQASNALLARLGIGSRTTAATTGFTPLTAAQFYATKQPYDDAVQAQQAYDSYLANNPARTADAGGQAYEGYGSLTKQFDAADLAKDLPYQNGLQFGLDTGINQLNARAASSGGYGSGAALKALTRFGNDYATTKTADAYNRNASEKNQLFSFLSGTAGQGLSAAGTAAGVGMGAAGNIAGLQTGIGNANAAGTVGGANALSGGIAGATNAFQWNQLLNKGKSGSYNMSEPYPGYNLSIGGA